MNAPPIARPVICAADILFFVLIVLYVLAGLCGTAVLTANGAGISADLCCYAQNMAAERHRGLFAVDPLLRAQTPANSIPNLESLLAELFTPGQNYAVGLVRAGALGVLLHYAAFYILGRFLFVRPSLAALLSAFTGVTVWFSFGTYWGFAVADVTPRVFFAALWPLLLLGAFIALERPKLRPLVMLLSGLGMYLHGLSSLNASCVFFTVFLLRRASAQSRREHLANLGLCLVCAALPTLFFLRDSLGQAHAFTADDLTVFQEVFARRFSEDHGDILFRLAGHFLWGSDTFPLFCGGLAGFFVARRFGPPETRKLMSLYPPLLLGMSLVIVLSVTESCLAPLLGRLSMGQELVRGVRFLAPLCWVAIVAALACFWGRMPRALRCLAVLGLTLPIVLLDQGWASATRFEAARLLGLQPQAAVAQSARGAENYRQALEALDRLAPPGAAAFGARDAMAVRYLLHRPLLYSFKDGSSYLYNKDAAGARDWLRLTTLSDREGPVAAWLATGADWFLCSRIGDREKIVPHGDIIWENEDWFVARRRANSDGRAR
ncbi:MAG: translation initiation factor 2 [Desulfovibrio sp.]|jgi:hypothetical protein|nr:translation initiation factor 2 [Desulfovibrio sp.]